MFKIAVFASGKGTNAEALINYFKAGSDAEVRLVLTDNSTAPVRSIASKHSLMHCSYWKEQFSWDSAAIMRRLKLLDIDYIVLAGFLSYVSTEIINAYRGRIFNIHPSLLPKYGGKGMYGEAVHKAVIAAGEKESGITIHHVNENYDEGDIIAQYKVEVSPEDTPETLAAKIHELEHYYYPRIVHQEIRKHPDYFEW
jgi:phosphoribosylglycinamide formyltransferase-1